MSCGNCTACCTALGVAELGWDKPPGVRCQHLCSHGCLIYSEKPEICSEYACLWLTADGANESLRPDHLGVLLSPQGADLFLAMETRPGALLETRVKMWLSSLRHNGFDIEVDNLQISQYDGCYEEKEK